jgi:hypothetical protein
MKLARLQIFSLRAFDQAGHRAGGVEREHQLDARPRGGDGAWLSGSGGSGARGDGATTTRGGGANRAARALGAERGEQRERPAAENHVGDNPARGPVVLRRG